MRELKSVEEKILDRALYLIGKNRSSSVSIRAIAKEANVNVSAINYYFRTKEEMLRQAKEFFITNILSITSILDSEEYEDEEKLVLASNEVMEYTLRFPGITALLREASNLEEVDEISRKILNTSRDMNSKLERVLCRVIKSENPIDKYNTMIFMSSIIYPVDNMDVVSFDREILDGRENRIRYIQYMIRLLKAM